MAYSNKEQVNQLTALLVAHGVRHAVVCPGSRNAPIVHNFNECPHITCYGVTDERSAGFYALGMLQALNEPIAVCVTSGSALLNLLPAVAEAWYQHMPLIVVSADRPQQWIDQLDGQTLPQPGALGRFVRCAVTLPEADAWHCNRLINEALLAATQNDDCRPVHINVAISEPLFTFDTAQLPAVRHILRTVPTQNYDCLHQELVDGLAAARRPMIVFGQTYPPHFDGTGVDYLFSHVIVLHESLSAFPSVSHFDEVLYAAAESSQKGAPFSEKRASIFEKRASFFEKGGTPCSSCVVAPPDFIVYVGDVIVSKRLRRFLRRAKDAVTWRISRSGDVEDTFQNLRGIVVGDPEQVLQSLNSKLNGRRMAGGAYRRQWLKALQAASRHAASYEPAYSQMAAVKLLEAKMSALPAGDSPTLHVHYANSSAVRLANIYAAHHVWCNRGVNGIEGSLSTAAGFSCVVADKVVCVIGDLSFFYDQNALWNRHLRGNLRILLLNNGRGGIFNLLPGLEQSPARDSLVAAAHDTSAEGICRQNNIEYIKAESMKQLPHGLDTLLFTESTRPVVLEVMTDATQDEQALKDYYHKLTDIQSIG